MKLDLGCGGNLHPGCTGIDIVGKPNTAADIVCNLGFEPIPVEDNSCEEVVSHHFIEHIPFAIWYEPVSSGNKQFKRFLPMVYLFNEIYRVMSNRAIFKVTVPIAQNSHVPHQQAFQDITHVSFWVSETPRYLSGDYYGFHDVYGHTSRFQLTKQELAGWVMYFELTAIKDVPEDTPFNLTY